MCSEAELGNAQLGSAAPRKKIQPCHPLTLLEDGACKQEANAVSLGTQATLEDDKYKKVEQKTVEQLEIILVHMPSGWTR